MNRASSGPAASKVPAHLDGQVELHEFSIRAGNQTLLDRASASFPAGQITLVVGASGAGKSLLLRAIAGLLATTDSGVQVDGQLRIGSDKLPCDDPSRRSSSGRARVGVVFQHFALFDELSPLDNVRMALAHREAAKGQRRDPRQLLEQLQVPSDVPTGLLSGGQRQRLAIARTLAYDPDVLLYDEPTSGLDPVTANHVAGLIRATHEVHGKTSIIVTHDYGSLAPIADKIYLLDTRLQRLSPVERTAWDDLPQLLRASAPSAVQQEMKTGQGGCTRRARAALAGIARFFANTSCTAEQILLLPWHLLPRWKSPAWGLRYLLHYLRLVAGPSAWIYLAVAGAIAGFVTTYFTFRFLPYAQYTKPLLVENLLESMGFALYRILVPVLATLLIAARCGAAVASDIGGKSYGQQLAALRSLGMSPLAYLKTNVLYAFLLGTPILTALAYLSATLTSLVVFVATHPQHGPDFWRLHYHRALVQQAAWLYQGSGWWLAKVLLCALGIAGVTYALGHSPKRSTHEVSRGITATILWSTLLVLVVHFAFAFWEFG